MDDPIRCDTHDFNIPAVGLHRWSDQADHFLDAVANGGG